jgi:hypothetical protein
VSKQRAQADAVARAKVYILAHSDESRLQQSVATGISTATIARARAELVHEGKLAASRKQRPVQPAAPPSPPTAAVAVPAPVGGLVDSVAMRTLADMIDTVSDEEDDAVTHRRLLKQCLMFAFDTTLHADTRMSASQMWQKLKDQTKARELGPGAPKTFAAVVDRLYDLMDACGAEAVLEAVNRFLTTRPSHEGDVPAVNDQAAPGDSGATPTP